MKKSLKAFFQQFYETSGCTFNLKSGRQDRRSDCEKARSKLRGFRKCCMNVSDKQGKENRPSLQPGKNTNCNAAFNFRLEIPKSKYKTGKEKKGDFPLWI